MDFEYTPEQLRFQDEVCRFLEETWGPADPTAGRDKRDREKERAFRLEVAKRGWLTIGWPKEWGGTDLTLMERYILSQEMNRHGAPISLYNVIVLGPLLIKYASEEAKNHFLPKMQQGQVDFVLGFTEPETGSDLANLQTRAVRQGDGYIINGQKLYGHPHEDDVVFLAARTDPDAPVRKGISIFLVDANSEGLAITRNKTLAGQEVGATYYDNVYVPRARLLGEENKGWDYVRETMDLDRAGGIPYAHFSVVFEGLVDYVKKTQVNGHPLADEPWVRERMGQLAIELEAAELLQDMTASKIAAGETLRMEASIVKAFCTEYESRLAGFAHELFGPAAALAPGATDDAFMGAMNFLRRLNVAMTIVGGTNEIQRNIIALQGLGLPRG